MIEANQPSKPLDGAGSPASDCSHVVARVGKPRYSSLKWNKLHPEKMRQARKDYEERNPNRKKEFYKRRFGVTENTHRNRKSQTLATMSKQPWGPVEDDVLMSGRYKGKELAKVLGRSLAAIEIRRWRLRQEEINANKQL